MSQEMYSTTELAQMNPEELEKARAAGFLKPLASTPLPASSPQNPYAVTSWGENEYDFRVPSGQLCRMRKLRPEQLVGSDLLDRVTRLPGFAQQAIDQAEGKPPAKIVDAPAKEDLQAVIKVMNELLPMVVVQPKVYAVPEPTAADPVPKRVPGVVYTDMIELGDRIAIMERAISGVSKMDNFRQES